MIRLRISSAAEGDIREITRYIARNDPVRALSFARELRDRIQMVGVQPELYAQREWRPGLRAVRHGRYLIIYRHDDGLTEILRVLHGARDIDSLLA